jgi:hypothetical protein
MEILQARAALTHADWQKDERADTAKVTVFFPFYGENNAPKNNDFRDIH